MIVEQHMLSEIQHNFVLTCGNDREPLFILYEETMRDVKGANLESVLQDLVLLVRRGFLRCIFRDEHGVTRACDDLSMEELKHYYSSRLEQDPEDDPRRPGYTLYGEYEFRMTTEGAAEAARECYRRYYPTDEG
ncbi:MAG: hypothetical protein NTU41_06890 [Chloroflexi bacterium]|nr:hypothetical protein [Chloroflexota bacterium]